MELDRVAALISGLICIIVGLAFLLNIGGLVDRQLARNDARAVAGKPMNGWVARTKTDVRKVGIGLLVIGTPLLLAVLA